MSYGAPGRANCSRVEAGGWEAGGWRVEGGGRWCRVRLGCAGCANTQMAEAGAAGCSWAQGGCSWMQLGAEGAAGAGATCLEDDVVEALGVITR